jgi:hypothetical protein
VGDLEVINPEGFLNKRDGGTNAPEFPVF